MSHPATRKGKAGPSPPKGEERGSETTLDDFLGGRLKIEQPAKGHRSGSDAVLLAAAVPAKGGDQIAELGAGVGVALFCLLARVAGTSGVGIEIDADAVELAGRNAARNAMEDRARFQTADLRLRLAALKPGSFDHVIANPPFFVDRAGTLSNQAGRAKARASAEGDLDLWTRRAADLLRHGGMFTLILRSERLADGLVALGQRFGGIEILPLRTGAASDRVILQARKGSRAPLTLAAEIVLQENGRYLPAIQKVLREVAPLRPGSRLRPAVELPPVSARPSAAAPGGPRRNPRSGRGTGGAS